MFRKAREHLARLREDPSSGWSLDDAGHRDADDDPFEGDAAAREAVLQALQVDRRPEDAGLLRHLLAQEVRYHEDSDVQGLTDSLSLACYLVGSLRAVEDVVLLARAKRANFDTECGLARQLLFATGVAETIAYARGLGEDGRSTLRALEDEGEPLCSQAEVDHYWRAMAEYYPATITAMHPLTLASIAVAQDEPAEAVAALERWLADATRIAEEADRTVALDARWAGYVVADLRACDLDAGLLARLDAVAAAMPTGDAPGD